MIDLTIVIPAFNESARLEAGFERLAPTLEVIGESSVEVIVVDDGSSDNTLTRAHEVYGHLEHALFLQQPRNLGKGAALRLGMGLARGTNVITADADMAIDPGQFPLFTTSLRDTDFVPGTRAVAGRIAYGSPLAHRGGRPLSPVRPPLHPHRTARHAVRLQRLSARCRAPPRAPSPWSTASPLTSSSFTSPINWPQRETAPRHVEGRARFVGASPA